MIVSIIIPTYNEAENMEAIIPYLFSIQQKSDIEIIVSDAGSTDNTVEIAKKKWHCCINLTD